MYAREVDDSMSHSNRPARRRKLLQLSCASTSSCHFPGTEAKLGRHGTHFQTLGPRSGAGGQLLPPWQLKSPRTWGATFSGVGSLGQTPRESLPRHVGASWPRTRSGNGGGLVWGRSN